MFLLLVRQICHLKISLCTLVTCGGPYYDALLPYKSKYESCFETRSYELPHIPLCFLKSQRRSTWHWKASINLLLTVPSRTSVASGGQFWLVVMTSTLKGETGESHTPITSTQTAVTQILSHIHELSGNWTCCSAVTKCVLFKPLLNEV